jgi:hypothetical protein
MSTAHRQNLQAAKGHAFPNKPLASPQVCKSARAMFMTEKLHGDLAT